MEPPTSHFIGDSAAQTERRIAEVQVTIQRRHNTIQYGGDSLHLANSAKFDGRNWRYRSSWTWQPCLRLPCSVPVSSDARLREDDVCNAFDCEDGIGKVVRTA